MAFLDCRDGALHALPGHAARTAPDSTTVAKVAPFFTPGELRVVELARGDGPKTLREQGKRGWLGRLVLGPLPPSPRLANDRLEALRRLAVHAWDKGYLLPASAMKEAMQAGYSEDQVGAIVDTIGRARSTRQFTPL